MGIQNSHLELVELAMSSNEGALQRLAEISQDPLRSYVDRIIFNHDLAEDIVQETLLEMFKIFKQLKQADHFWPWLCKIALNKIRIQSRAQSRHQKLLKEHCNELTSRSPKLDGLATAIQEEFKQCIFQAMAALSDRQKAVLSMRCYENMSYAQIAEVMGLSELGCRLLFIRARKKLQRKLYSLGYGQKSVLLALVLFGKFTATSEAAAAQVCLSPAVLSAGGLAAGIALITSKAVLTFIVGGVAVTGVVTMSGYLSDSQADKPVVSVLTTDPSTADRATHINEGYFLFPLGKQGPVLTRLLIHEGDKTVQVLQNDTGNYIYDADRQTVSIANSHYWKPDLSVMTLPTDHSALESFLAQMENRRAKSHMIISNSLNLFVVASEEEERQPFPSGVKNYDALMEERFQYNWPARTSITDHRDDLHKQGVCYFSIQGHVHGKAVSGNGRIPFIYTRALEKPAWLTITIAGELTVLDTSAGAVLLDAAGRPVSAYPAGTFHIGLNKPWSGLHVLDTVRRDAAQFRIPFETGLQADGRDGFVRLRLPDGKIEYTIDTEKDLIRRILMTDSANNEIGDLSFSYLIPETFGSEPFLMPRLPSRTGSLKTESLHWLSAIAANQLLSE